jgi:hypothetical protein
LIITVFEMPERQIYTIIYCSSPDYVYRIPRVLLSPRIGQIKKLPIDRLALRYPLASFSLIIPACSNFPSLLCDREMVSLVKGNGKFSSLNINCLPDSRQNLNFRFLPFGSLPDHSTS